jgi:hypothetical protein
MTRRITLSLGLLLGLAGATLDTATMTAPPAAACGDPHTS